MKFRFRRRELAVKSDRATNFQKREVTIPEKLQFFHTYKTRHSAIVFFFTSSGFGVVPRSLIRQLLYLNKNVALVPKQLSEI